MEREGDTSSGCRSPLCPLNREERADCDHQIRRRSLCSRRRGKRDERGSLERHALRASAVTSERGLQSPLGHRRQSIWREKTLNLSPE